MAKKGLHRSPETEFQPGHPPTESAFRKGHVPGNYKGEVGLPRDHPDYHKRWREIHRERWNGYSKKWQDDLRKQVFDHYGWACACCGETTIEFLTIDHVDGGGSKHRKTFKGPIYRLLVKEGFPENYQTLCMNCNFSIGIHGYCPHEKNRPT